MDAVVASFWPTLSTAYPWTDFFRLAAVFIPGIILLGMAVVLCYKYFRVFLLDSKLSRAQGRSSSWRGLLPIHVAAITFSYGGLVVMLLTSVVERFREPLYSTPRIIVYSVLLWIGVAALRIMSAHSRRRAVAIEHIQYPKSTGPKSGPPPLSDDSKDV